MRLRPAGEGDRAAVLALGVEEAAWFGEPESSAEEVGEWVDEEGGIATGVVAEEAGRAAGFAAPGRSEAVLLADPARTDAAIDALLPWLLERREDVALTTFAGDARRIAAFERHGLAHTHSGFSLLRDESAGPLPAAERRRGLGRALLLCAFTALARDGARGLALGVQAENVEALGLYRSVGLEVEREWRVHGRRA